MTTSNDRANPFVNAYSAAKSSGLLETPIGLRLFKSAYFLYKRYVEDDLRDLVRSFPALVGPENVLDIGANIGYTAAVLARTTASSRKVFAFEPEHFNFRLLQQTALRHEFEGKIVPLQYAVGAQNGIVDLWINDHHHADHRILTEPFKSEHPDSKRVSVPIVNIDSFVASNPGKVSFAKIDVQGYELAVCQGMQETLLKNPDITIVLEFMPSAMRELGFDPSQLIDFLIERDFSIYVVHPRGNLSRGMPPELKDVAYVNLLFSHRTIACDPSR